MPRTNNNRYDAQRAHRGGRIHPHQRDTDDNIAVLGDNLEPPSNLAEKYNETIKVTMTDGCRRNYRQRLLRIVEFWRREDPEYFAVGVREVPEEEGKDETKYFYDWRYKQDLIYSGLNDQFILHFLVSTKKKEDGKFKSFEDMRKYKDAIMWGAKIQGERLPSNFYETFDNFLSAYKKEFRIGKKAGLADETSSDPIPQSVYRCLLNWAVAENNVFVWFWTLAQWNFMARSASIDPLSFANFRPGTDSIIGKYDNSKMDKAGERLSEKNLYANANDFRLCYWTAMGIWIALRGNKMKGNNRLFLDKGVKEGTCAAKYCEQVATLVAPYKQHIAAQMDSTRFNPYGLRKGAATHAVSGTTAPPSIPSIARRGEWSIGSVLDVYWHFGSVGDQYLGRILAGHNPLSPDFDILPPHWQSENPLVDADVIEGMELTYGKWMMDEHAQFVPVLLRLFACIVFHSEALIRIMVLHPGHDFNKLSILHRRELLQRLHQKVTIEPTNGLVATGIPPHIEHSRQLSSLLARVDRVLNLLADQNVALVNTVKKAIDDHSWESGNVSGSMLKTILDGYKNDSLREITTRIDSLREEVKNCLQDRVGTTNGGEIQTPRTRDGGRAQDEVGNVFAYEGRFYGVPSSFQFPRATLKEGLRLWFGGQTVSEDGRQIIRPFRKLTLSLLPKKLHDTYKVQWRPIFTFIEAGMKDTENGGILPPNFTGDNLEKYYVACLEFLRRRVSYCFKKGNAGTWSTGTWSNRIQRSTILKMGTEDDKRQLGDATNRNVPKKPASGTRRKRWQCDRPRYLERQRKRQQTDNNDGQQHVDGDGFMDAFADIGEMTEGMRRRDEEIQERVEVEDRAQRIEDGQRILRETGFFVTQARVINRDDVSGFHRQAFAQRELEHLLGNSDNEDDHRGQQARRKPNDDVERGTTPPEGTSRGPSVGTCPIPGCTWTTLMANHPCYRAGCTKYVHNLCAQSSNLCDDDNELNMYCSVQCKQIGC